MSHVRIEAMTAILYPVADTAEAALHAPKGFAARERQAGQIAGEAVAFATETVGPAFETRDAALDFYAGQVEDERAGRPNPPPEARWRQLLAVAAAPGARFNPPSPVKPVYKDGRRWPEPAPPPAGSMSTLWRLSVSFWRIGAPQANLPDAPARQLRRDPTGRELAPETLRALARQALRPVQPQQPLDIGLFEVRLPEDPSHIVPDE
jgi:hypothetical protein